MIQCENEIAIVSTLYSMPNRRKNGVYKNYFEYKYAASLGHLDIFRLNNQTLEHLEKLANASSNFF